MLIEIEHSEHKIKVTARLFYGGLALLNLQFVIPTGEILPFKWTLFKWMG